MYGNISHVPDDPQQILLAASLHAGIVKDVDDPKGRGRVRVEVPSVFDEGEDCWTDWCEIASTPIGSNQKGGDHGVWWPMSVGQLVLVGFEGGNVDKPYAFPGTVWLKDDKPLAPAEISKADEDKKVRMYCLKDPAGNTLFFDSNGKHEAFYLCDWTGAGFFSMAPGKQEDERSAQCKESKPRKNDSRGTKTAFAQTSKKPSELIEGGTAVTGTLDLLGQGVICIAKDGEGTVVITAAKQMGEPKPSIVLDAKDNRIILAAGETQLVVDGGKGHIEVTRQIIKEVPPLKVQDAVSQLLNSIKSFFQGYTGAGA